MLVQIAGYSIGQLVAGAWMANVSCKLSYTNDITARYSQHVDGTFVSYPPYQACFSGILLATGVQCLLSHTRVRKGKAGIDGHTGDQETKGPLTTTRPLAPVYERQNPHLHVVHLGASKLRMAKMQRTIWETSLLGSMFNWGSYTTRVRSLHSLNRG